MSAPIIDLQARFVRDGRVLLDDVRWTVRRGEHWALLGANGAGKTTLLNIVAGYEWPSEGWVSVLAERYGECDMRSLKSRVGFVTAGLSRRMHAQQSAVEVATSGLAGMIGNWRAWTEEELARGRQALARMGAADVADKPFSVLSEGEKQRTAIARALIADPALLVLDEPFAGLDPAARERLLVDLARCCAQAPDTSMVLVTHHVEEIPTFVTHALVLRGGRVLASGPKEEVLTSAVLGEAFDADLALEARDGRYSLRAVRLRES